MTDDLSTVRRDRVIAWLRDLADRIEGGTLHADAATVILSEGDIHRPARIGYTDDTVWHHVSSSLHDGYGVSDPSPEDRADWRAQQKQDRVSEQEAYDRAYPWRCACNQRFKTHRGWKSHRGAHRRRWGDGLHDTVVEVDVPDPEPPIQLFPQSS